MRVNTVKEPLGDFKVNCWFKFYFTVISLLSHDIEA